MRYCATVMAHGLTVLKRSPGNAMGCKNEGKSGIGSRRIFPPHFKLQVLDSYRNDDDCKGNQRATARKYGIHRRQIQKWLQAETNLRNSVGKGKSIGECVSNPEARKCGIESALRAIEHRPRDDSNSGDSQTRNVADARVPAINPPDVYSSGSEDQFSSPIITAAAPLDFTTHSRGHGSPAAASPVPPFPLDPAGPMDLSLKRPISQLGAPVFHPPSPHPSLYSSPPPMPRSPTPQPDVWDLSTRPVKRKFDDTKESFYSPNSTANDAPKPIKLFKPYLDDVHENLNEDKIQPEVTTPICCPRVTYPHIESPIYYNNNNICHLKTEYTYTLHDLHPKSYYYPAKSYICSPTECDLSPPQYCTYDEPSFMQLSPPLKQRQSYSLDFKLSAIECYYQDELCRGNQRAVANKYNIHRRQVQKWLKQEEELRERNECVKHVSVVR